MLCNPHNPTGRAFTRDELTRIADICLRHDIIILSDEIHSDLTLNDTRHIPIATLSPEVAARTVTMIAPTKTFNIPGLPISIMIVPDAVMRQKIVDTSWGLGLHVNTLGFTAAEAAYRHGDAWLKEVLAYIGGNLVFAASHLRRHMPMLRFTVPEATYLMWIDCSALPLPDGQTAHEFFLKQARCRA